MAAELSSTAAPDQARSGPTLRFKLVIAYDGTRYQGWQTQQTGVGIQQKIEEALAKIFPGAPRVYGSSRTDTGVHALGLVAHVDIAKREFRMPVKKLALALNAWLPEEIRIMSAMRSGSQFHARFDATGKQYRYFLWNHSAMNPLLRQIAWHVPQPVNLASMQSA